MFLTSIKNSYTLSYIGPHEVVSTLQKGFSLTIRNIGWSSNGNLNYAGEKTNVLYDKDSETEEKELEARKW